MKSSGVRDYNEILKGNVASQVDEEKSMNVKVECGGGKKYIIFCFSTSSLRSNRHLL